MGTGEKKKKTKKTKKFAEPESRTLSKSRGRRAFDLKEKATNDGRPSAKIHLGKRGQRQKRRPLQERDNLKEGK